MRLVIPEKKSVRLISFTEKIATISTKDVSKTLFANMPAT